MRDCPIRLTRAWTRIRRKKDKRSNAIASSRVAAASALLDRGWGKAPQTIKHEGLEERLRNADDATLDRIAAKAMAALGYPVDDDDGGRLH